MSTAVRSSMIGSGDSWRRWISGAFGAVEGGPAGRLAARLRRGVGGAGCSVVSWVCASGSWGSSIKLLYGAYAHFLVRAPAHGRAAEAYGTDVVNPSLPRSSVGCFIRSPLVAVEDQVHLLSRRVTPRNVCHRGWTHQASEPPPVSHTSQPTYVFVPCRRWLGVSRSLVPRLGDGSGMGVEPTLGEPSQDRGFDGSELRTGHLQAGQHVVGSDQRCLMSQRHG